MRTAWAHLGIADGVAQVVGEAGGRAVALGAVVVGAAVEVAPRPLLLVLDIAPQNPAGGAAMCEGVCECVCVAEEMSVNRAEGKCRKANGAENEGLRLLQKETVQQQRR